MNQGIDFGSHPHFSKLFLVEGEDELKIRNLFGDELLAFFEAHLKISVEGGSGEPSITMNPADYPIWFAVLGLKGVLISATLYFINACVAKRADA